MESIEQILPTSMSAWLEMSDQWLDSYGKTPKAEELWARGLAGLVITVVTLKSSARDLARAQMKGYALGA